jgi:hypothetical protein
MTKLVDKRGRKFEVGQELVVAKAMGSFAPGLVFRTVSKIEAGNVYVAGQENVNRHYKLSNLDNAVILD